MGLQTQAAGIAAATGRWQAASLHAGTYRPDIDGLRALAVLAVVIGHVWPTLLPGGYIGVDVFFVISGYLITQILTRELAAGRLDLRAFYERRARRLFPALFTVLTATFAAATLVMLPSDLSDMLRALLATVFFSANLLFWRESVSYFGATESLGNPLLHLWSLGVEEQFYLFFPWLLVAVFAVAARRGLDRLQLLRGVLVLLTLAGLGLAAAVAARNTSAAFYLSPLRAWEFMAGALAALLPPWGARWRWLREGLAAASLAVLLACAWRYSAHMRFPGWSALPPVLAAALLLHGGGARGITAWLGAAPCVGIGLISYSLYLWHWPVLVLARQLAPASLAWDLASLGLAVLLSVLTWRWVEQPWRRPAGARPGRGPAWAVTAAMGLVLLAGIGLWQQGLAWRVPPEVRRMDLARDEARIPWRECADRPVSQACVLGDAGAPQVLAWGDSHLLAWAPALDRAMAGNGRGLRLAIHLSCPPLLGVDNQQARRCASANQEVWAHLQAHPQLRTVVLAAHWTHYFRPQGPLRTAQGQPPRHGLAAAQQALQATVQQLVASGRSVVLVGPVPTHEVNVPQALALHAWHGRPVPGTVAAEQVQRQSGFWQAVQPLRALPQVRVLDPTAWLCRPDCLMLDGGRSLYRDEQHLHDWGARWAEPWLARGLGLSAVPLQP